MRRARSSCASTCRGRGRPRARPVAHARSGEPDRSARHFHPETRAARDPRSGRSAATPPGPLPSSSRACSVACTVFFQAAAELRDRPPDRREARRRRQRLLPLHQRPIRLLPDQDREPRQLRGQARRPPPRLAARRDLTRLAPPRLQAVDPRPTHRILLRHQLRRHAGVAVLELPASVNPGNTQPSVPSFPQEYHDRVLGTSEIRASRAAAAGAPARVQVVRQ